jgi:hypothetical protein
MLVAPAEPVLTGEKLIVSFRLPDDGMWAGAEAYQDTAAKVAE